MKNKIVLRLIKAYYLITCFIFLTTLQACGQSNVFEFEKDIKSAFEMDDSLMYFSYGYEEEGKGLAFKLSEIKKVNVAKLDSIFNSKINSQYNEETPNLPLEASNEVKLNKSSILKTWNTRNPSYKLEIGNVVFTVDVDFEKCIIYDIHNYYGHPREGQIVGFKYSKDSEEPLSYRAYSHNSTRTGLEISGSGTLEEKRYFFTDKYTVNERDINGMANEKKELYELGVKIHRIVTQLLLTYKENCPPNELRIEFDLPSLKYKIDSIFSLSTKPEYDVNKDRIKLDSHAEFKLVMQITFNTSVYGKLEKIQYEVLFVSDSINMQYNIHPRINSMIQRTLKQNINFNKPKYMCMPCAAEKHITIILENNIVTQFYY